jgi:hypothetical protein
MPIKRMIFISKQIEEPSKSIHSMKNLSKTIIRLNLCLVVIYDKGFNINIYQKISIKLDSFAQKYNQLPVLHYYLI